MCSSSSGEYLVVILKIVLPTCTSVSQRLDTLVNLNPLYTYLSSVGVG